MVSAALRSLQHFRPPISGENANTGEKTSRLFSSQVALHSWQSQSGAVLCKHVLSHHSFLYILLEKLRKGANLLNLLNGHKPKTECTVLMIFKVNTW